MCNASNIYPFDSYNVMACKVFPAFSINVSSRFRFVGAFICGSEMSKVSAAEAVLDVDQAICPSQPVCVLGGKADHQAMECLQAGCLEIW